MRHDPIFTSWLVCCPSEEVCGRLQAFLAHRINPDAMFENVVQAWPDGSEMRSVEQHRLGDYFADVRLLPGSGENASAFRILFHRRSDAGRFWKDLMVRVLESLREESANVTTTLEYRGDEEPVVVSTC